MASLPPSSHVVSKEGSMSLALALSIPTSIFVQMLITHYLMQRTFPQVLCLPPLQLR